MTNCDANGIRYSYFSFNELAEWCSQDLFYGAQARDLSYEEAVEQLKAEAKRLHASHCEEAEIAANETDANMAEEDFERFIASWFEDRNIYQDEEDFVAAYLESKYDHIQIDEPIIEGELDGVSYRISWLGGAPHIFVLKGPLGYGNRLCSPCVPGAADPSGGFTLASEVPEGGVPDGHLCYCVPRDWLRAEE